MAITRWPQGVDQNQTVTCAICQQKTLLLEVTAGARTHSGKQAFACDRHFNFSTQFIVGWADFAVRDHDSTGNLTELAS